MKTIILKIDKNKPEADKLKQAAEVLKTGGVVVIPTDTVYGLAANAFSVAAQKKIYSIKGRSFRKPLILMPPDLNSLKSIAHIPERSGKLIKKFWPGPLTVVLATTELGKLVSGGRSDIGVRIPASDIVRALLKVCGFPILTTSVNLSGKPSAKSGGEAAKYMNGKVELVIDCGRCDLGRESTVVDITHFPGTVIREGCLSKKDILKCIQ
jgi:L-threonylcarbamoyladenylate synthase